MYTSNYKELARPSLCKQESFSCYYFWQELQCNWDLNFDIRMNFCKMIIAGTVSCRPSHCIVQTAVPALSNLSSRLGNIVQGWPASRPYATYSQSTLKTSVGVCEDRSLPASAAVATAPWLSVSMSLLLLLLLLLLLFALAVLAAGLLAASGWELEVVFCSCCRCVARLSLAARKVFSISCMQLCRQSCVKKERIKLTTILLIFFLKCPYAKIKKIL